MEIPLGLMLLFFFVRLSCLPVLLLHTGLGIFGPRQKRDRWMNGTAIAFLVLLLLPFDIEIAGFHGLHFGTGRSGPRFVRLVMGLGARANGEYIAGGCCVTGNDPKWLFVWEEAGLKPHTARMRLMQPAEQKPAGNGDTNQHE